MAAKAGGAQLVFQLSAPANVSVSILNLAGRPVRSLPPINCAPGLNTLLWDGKNDAGLRVPAGVYLVQLTARSPEGDQSRGLTQLSFQR
jgi:flagellar hook assembly protein FlgD